MINIDLLRNAQTREQVVAQLGIRGVELARIEELLAADTAWREATRRMEALQAQKNEASERIANASSEEKQQLIARMQEIKMQEQDAKQELEQAVASRDALWRFIPNIPLPDVQAGGEEDSQIIAESAVQPLVKEKTPRSYLDLMGDRIDLRRAAKVSGARFAYLAGDLARLEFGIVSFVLDSLASHGFTQVVPPVLIQEQAMAGMGYLDQAGDEVYKTQDNLYLVGTSEQSLGAMHMDEILSNERLPLRYVSFSSCFRREAGSHGKDVKGILRLHQFDKVEMFSITTPATSEQEHQFLLERQRDIMDALRLPYRIVRLAAGDLGAPSAKTYDIETWIPSEGVYRETHSTSNTTDYQSRRLNIRYKDANGNTGKVHMLNGTAVALSRLLIALIENHQRPDGSVKLPEPLVPYLPFASLAPNR